MTLEELKQIPKSDLPVHIGIIMDGNGRWAQEKGKPRTFGHKEGLEAAKRVVKAAADLGISYITLYTFSTENWKRSTTEVDFLMQLIQKHLKKEMDFYRQNKIRVRHSGDTSALPGPVLKEINDVIHDTAEFSATTVNLAINYGGRDEIIRAITRHRAATDSPITEESLSQYLDCNDIPDPDMIIRTANEIRLSNFLLWQSAYSELYFDKKPWPEWQADDLHNAVIHYLGRVRKFGGVK